ncbi:MAG: TrmO family methyltransferase [Candidatus Ancaeobacter aquaticus]|nr:TrmO family methyltransferase [Candidatus Ancaeobacter aquaticus]
MAKEEAIDCVECGARCSKDECSIIDNKTLCYRCLFGDVSPVSFYPIGFVLNEQDRDSSDFGLSKKGNVSRIELFDSQKRFMYKLEEESGLTVVYYLHKSRMVRSKFKRGYDGKKVGVFASRTPDRLSRIGIQDVQLLEVSGTMLVVEGLDAVNGTPVLDIKMRWKKK